MKKVSDNLRAEIKERIGVLKELERNWNGYGALPLNRTVLLNIQKIFEFDYPGLIYGENVVLNPTGRNSVIVQIRKDNKDFMFVEVSFDEFTVAYIKSNGFTQETIYNEANIESIVNKIKEFLV